MHCYITPLFLFGSLADNQLCGLKHVGLGNITGTYTPEGIIKLGEGLKRSAVTLLKCAAAQ